MWEKLRKLRNALKLNGLGILAGVGSVCSIITFFVGVFAGQAWILAFGYTIFAVSLSAIVFYEVHYRKKCELNAENARKEHNADQSKLRKQLADVSKVARRKLAEASRLINVYQGKSYEFHLVFHHLREANTLLLLSGDFNEDRHARFKGCLIRCLSRMSDFFCMLMEKDCALCIKLLKELEDPIKVFTLVRDGKSEWRNVDDEMIYELQKNTAFDTIFNSNNRWFYSADLGKESLYQNQNVRWLKDRHYMTTAVLPIQAPGFSDEGEEYQGIKGFLCLDSAEANAFPEQPTVNILACLADILYITLMHYKRLEWSGKDGR